MSDPKYSFSFNHNGNEYTFNSNYTGLNFINSRKYHYLNKNINKLITFFDANEDNYLNSVDSDSKDVKYFFNKLKKYIKDHILTDEEIADFIQKNEDISDISVDDFKDFLTRYQQDSKTTSSEKSSTYTIYPLTNNSSEEEVEIPVKEKTTCTIRRNSSGCIEEYYKTNLEKYNCLLNSRNIYYDENDVITRTIEKDYDYKIKTSPVEHIISAHMVSATVTFSKITDTSYENGKIIQKTESFYKDGSDKPYETRVSKYTDGVLTEMERTQYIDGNEIVEKIEYENNKPVKVIKNVNREYVSTSVIQEAYYEIEKQQQDGSILVDTMDIISVETENADGTIFVTDVSRVDEFGNYTKDDFIQRVINDGNKITTVEKKPILNVTDEKIELLGFQLFETIVSNNYVEENIYSSDDIFGYEKEQLYLTAQAINNNGRESISYYDGKGNTIIYYQNGETYSRIENTFRGDLSEEEFLTAWKALNGNALSLQVGGEGYIPGEIKADDIRLTTRNAAEIEIAEYTNWYLDNIYKTVVTSEHKEYVLEKDYNNAWELAKDILKKEYEISNPTKNDINNLAWEITSLNGKELHKDDLKKGTNIYITTPTRVNDTGKTELDNLGISTSDIKNNTFFVNFAKLSPKKQEIALGYIKDYCKNNNIEKLSPEQFEILKENLVRDKSICLTNSGRYIKNQADFWKNLDGYGTKYDGKTFSLESFLKDIGVNFSENNSDGQKLYHRFASLSQEYLNQIPFGILMDEIQKCKENKIPITCDLVTDLVEQITLFNMTIRIENGQVDKEAMAAKMREVQRDTPYVVNRLLEEVFSGAVKSVKESLAEIDENAGFFASVCDWLAEGIEDVTGWDTDNREDVTDQLAYEKKLINLLKTNPAYCFKKLTGLDLTYENIEKVLDGNFELQSVDYLDAYLENVQDYKILSRAIAVALISIAVTALCPVAAPAAGLMGKATLFAINLAKTSFFTGVGTVAYDLIDRRGDMDLGDIVKSLGEGAMVGAFLVTGNAFGSVVMQGASKVFPSTIKISSDMSFKTLAFGNTYSAGFWNNALCYTAESALQNGATAALYGRDVLNYKEYIWCPSAGLSAIKVTKLLKNVKGFFKGEDTVSDVTNNAVREYRDNFLDPRQVVVEYPDGAFATAKKVEAQVGKKLEFGLGSTKLIDLSRHPVLKNFIDDIKVSASNVRNDFSNLRHFTLKNGKECLVDILRTGELCILPIPFLGKCMIIKGLENFGDTTGTMSEVQENMEKDVVYNNNNLEKCINLLESILNSKDLPETVELISLDDYDIGSIDVKGAIANITKNIPNNNLDEQDQNFVGKLFTLLGSCVERIFNHVDNKPGYVAKEQVDEDSRAGDDVRVAEGRNPDEKVV